MPTTDPTAPSLISRFERGSLVPLTAVEARTSGGPTVLSSAKDSSVMAAHDLLVGAIPTSSWMIDERNALLGLRVPASLVIFPFDLIEHRDFLTQLNEWGCFDWRVEGCFNALVRIKMHSALERYIQWRDAQ